MVTLEKIKQDYKEITEQVNGCKSLEDLLMLNNYLENSGHKTLIEINGEPIDEITSINDKDIKYVRLDDYNDLCYIYFNKWQDDRTAVTFDAYIEGDFFIEDLSVDELDEKYCEYVNYLMETKPELVSAEVMADLAKSDKWQNRREAAWSNKTPAEVLEKLANDSDESVRQAVAVNKNTPFETLEQLCKDADIDVRNYAQETLNMVFIDSLSESEMAEFEAAKKIISKYVQSEYSSEGDFSDLKHIGIGYTEIGSEKQGDFSLQVEADLINCEINYYIAGEIAKTEKYDSLEEMNRDCLSALNFDDMLYVGTTELDRILEEKAAAINVVLAVSQNDTSRYYIANDVTEDSVKNVIVNSEKLFMDICALGGKQISEVKFAEYSQTEGVTAFDINIDEQTMHVYGADKPFTAFAEICAENNKEGIIENTDDTCVDYIMQLNDVIATCEKIKEAIKNGNINLVRGENVSRGNER